MPNAKSIHVSLKVNTIKREGSKRRSMVLNAPKIFKKWQDNFSKVNKFDKNFYEVLV